MLRRLAVAAVAATVAAVATPAVGKPATCPMVKDQAGDVVYTLPGQDESALDILSADVATDARNLTAVIRLKSTDHPSVAQPLSRGYWFAFSVVETRFLLAGSRRPDGADAYLYYREAGYNASNAGAEAYAGIAPIGISIDDRAHEIRLVAPLAQFAARQRIGRNALRDLRVSTFRGTMTPHLHGPVYDIGSGGAEVGADDATSSAVYVPGRSRCSVRR